MGDLALVYDHILAKLFT